MPTREIKRDSLIKMWREAAEEGGEGGERKHQVEEFRHLLFHSSYRFTGKEICDESGTSWYPIGCFAVYTQMREFEMKIS